MSELNGLAPGSVPRLLIGQQLRRLRTRKGIHTELAAAEAGVARATLWRFEKGDNRCRYKIGDVERLGRIYGADPETTLILVALARATRGRTWTAAYRDLLTDSAETLIDLEGYASRIRCYDSAVVSELLQHEDYARALIASTRSTSWSDARRHLQIRLNRQRVLGREPATTMFEFVLDEAALHRGVGEPPTMMVAQLHRLIERADQPNIRVRIVPYRRGTYPGLATGPFTLLDFPSGQLYGTLPTTVQLERHNEILLLDAVDEVKLYEERWNDIAGRALDELGSRNLIMDAANRLKP